MDQIHGAGSGCGGPLQTLGSADVTWPLSTTAARGSLSSFLSPPHPQRSVLWASSDLLLVLVTATLYIYTSKQNSLRQKKDTTLGWWLRVGAEQTRGAPCPTGPHLGCARLSQVTRPLVTPFSALHLSHRRAHSAGSISESLELTHLSSAAPYRPSTRDGQVEEGVSVAVPRGDMDGSRSRVTDISESCGGERACCGGRGHRPSLGPCADSLLQGLTSEPLLAFKLS